MLRWRIIGSDVPDIFIYARSFDEALKKARLRSSNYYAGYVDDDE